eukprot:6069801-Amphidinium_carterae.1
MYVPSDQGNRRDRNGIAVCTVFIRQVAAFAAHSSTNSCLFEVWPMLQIVAVALGCLLYPKLVLVEELLTESASQSGKKLEFHPQLHIREYEEQRVTNPELQRRELISRFAHTSISP